MKKKLCIVDTPYSLLIFLLSLDYEGIMDTFFVFGENMPPEIAKRFPYSYHFQRCKSKLYRRCTRWLVYRFQKWRYLPQIDNNTQIYAHDHLPVSPVIIGHRPYIMIEDSPFICSHYISSPAYQNDIVSRHSFKTIIYRYLYGPLVNNSFADNSQCQAILMTVDDPADYIRSKKHLVCSLSDTWNQCSDNKREFILATFGLSQTDIEQLRSRPEVLFTQPLTDVISVSEQEKIYKEIAQKYSPERLIIKVHPRDEICYEHILPDYIVFRKKIPSQLLDLLGIRYERAITLFSSAAISFSYPIEVDWYGTEINQKLFNHYGSIEMPCNFK